MIIIVVVAVVIVDPWGNTNRVVSNRVVSKGPLYRSKTKIIRLFVVWYDPVCMPLTGISSHSPTAMMMTMIIIVIQLIILMIILLLIIMIRLLIILLITMIIILVIMMIIITAVTAWRRGRGAPRSRSNRSRRPGRRTRPRSHPRRRWLTRML